MKKLLAVLAALFLLFTSACALEVELAEPEGDYIAEEKAVALARERLWTMRLDEVEDFDLPELDKAGKTQVKCSFVRQEHNGSSGHAWVVTIYADHVPTNFYSCTLTLDAATGEILFEDYRTTATVMYALWVESLGHCWTTEQAALFDQLYKSPDEPGLRILPDGTELSTDEARSIAVDHLMQHYGVTEASLTEGIRVSYQLMRDLGATVWVVLFYDAQDQLVGQANAEAHTGVVFIDYSITDPGFG